MMMCHKYCIIMAGGFSTHFWPIAREDKPKQFLDFPGIEGTFIQNTYRRCQKVVPKENVIVIGCQKNEELIKEQLPDLPENNLLLEPYSRHTAPCIAYATYVILKRDPAAVVLVTPSDLVIQDEDVFITKITRSFNYVGEHDVLLTLGVPPSRPDPSFGYIQIAGGKRSEEEKDLPIKVKTFTEKPDIEIAKVFCSSGEFYWNSGMFLWQAEVIREELEKYTPEITRLFEGWEVALGSPAEQIWLERAYTDCPNISIDYGIMEKTDRAWLCPVNFGWCDIDTWETMYDFLPQKDKENNLCCTEDRYVKGAKDNVVISFKKDKLICINGLEDFVIIDTDDVLMICPKDEKKYRDFIAGIGMPGYEKFR